MKVLAVSLHVLCQSFDSLGEQRHLYFRRPGIGRMNSVSLDERYFSLLFQLPFYPLLYGWDYSTGFAALPNPLTTLGVLIYIMAVD